MIDVETVFDRLETRCPRLGGTVTFKYCRKGTGALPCSRSIVCWELHFPAAEYMVRILTAEEWTETFECPSKGRLDAILEAAKAASEDKSE